MKVDEVLAQMDDLFGNEVTIEGFVVERAPEYHIYLAPDRKSIDDLFRSIRVIAPFPDDELSKRFPDSLVGSRYAFLGSARLSGTLAESDDDNFPAFVTDLTHLAVRMLDGKDEFEISLDPQQF